MNPGDVVLVPIPQFAGGSSKLRPALFLAPLPGPYQTLLLCGISTQLGPIDPAWDELLAPPDAAFLTSGLKQRSVIRLSYLYAAVPQQVVATLGTIDPPRLTRLRQRLADQVRP